MLDSRNFPVGSPLELQEASMKNRMSNENILHSPSPYYSEKMWNTVLEKVAYMG